MPDPVCTAIHEKVGEQIERIDHLLQRLPALPGDWVPDIPGAQPISWLLDHLVDSVDGFCAVLYAVYPEQLAHLLALRDTGMPHALDPAGTRTRLQTHARQLDEGFLLLTDAALTRRIPTVFVPAGETVATLLLGNLEHLISHKYQLFLYAKMAGAQVNTPDLYRFRGL